MDFLTGGILCIGLLLVLMAAGMQIGLAFLLAGFAISTLLLGFDSTISLLGHSTYFTLATPTWTAIPLFILLGSFASSSGLARRAYDGVNALSRGLPGSLMVATSFGCALFGAVSGASIATAAVFGKMALPEMNRLGYDKSLSVGCIASAGTVASMIPPSLMMMVYALFTQQSIGKLFAAGVIVTLLFGWMMRQFRRVSDVTGAMYESANVTAMLFLINIGALFYSRVLSIIRLPKELTLMLQTAEVAPVFILIGVMAIMFFLGMIMVPVGIYALTLPIVFPLLVSLGYDGIWFGVIAMKLTEIGAITPPVGLNVFAIKGVIPKSMNISLEDIYRGYFPFILCDFVVLILLIIFPGIALWLPNLLM